MQHGHVTPLQLDAMSHRTMQSVQTNALHGSSSGLFLITRHKGHRGWSSMSGLLELASIWSCTEKPVCMGEAIPHMAAIFLARLLWAGSACEL